MPSFHSLVTKREALVKMFSTLFVSFVASLTIFTGVAVEGSDDGHSHAENFDPFHEILEIYGLKEGQNISVANLSSIIEELFMHKFGCASLPGIGGQCETCLTTDNIFTIVDALPEDGLTEVDFEKASVVIVTYLLDLAKRCAVGGNPAATEYGGYAMSLQNFDKATEYHALVDAMVERLNLTYNPHEKEEAGEHGHEEHGHDELVDKCLNEERFISNMKIEESSKPTVEMVEKTAAAFVFYLLKGYEFKTVCIDLPKKEDFLNDLFKVLGAPVDTLTEQQFIELLKKLKIATEAAAEGAVDPHAGHNHRRKRSVVPLARSKRSDASWLEDVLAAMDRRERVVSEQRETVVEKRAIKQVTADECLDVHQLMMVHKISEADGVTKAKFIEVCPALIQQQVSGACTATTTPPTGPATKTMTASDSFGYGTLMVLAISLMAMLGALMVPFLNTDMYKSLIVVFIALAVATMSADALLHLMPQALGLHNHGDHDSPAGHGVQLFVWKQLVVICSMYLFFLVECIMAFLRRKPNDEDDTSSHGHSHGHGHSHFPLALSSGRSSTSKGKNGASATNNGGAYVVKPDSLSDVKTVDSSNDVVYGIDNPAFAPGQGELSDVSQNSNHNNIRRLSEVTKLEQDEDKKEWSIKDVKSVAVMILIGDTLHNFIDGIAIGAAFAQDLNSGISTSIAVLCHELPHELGDFAVLISSGMPIKWALGLNFVSACSAFIGLYIGIGIAVDMATRQWIFALTAGMFLYVALVNMLPELMNQKAGGRIKTFILQNVGLLTGFAIMLLIAIFEEQITIA